MKESLPWKIEITKADNGYIASWYEELLDKADYCQYKQIVFEEDQSEGKPATLMNLLFFLKDYFGEYSDKYDKFEVDISLKHGSKYTCDDKKCEICKEMYHA